MTYFCALHKLNDILVFFLTYVAYDVCFATRYVDPDSTHFS